MTDTPPPQQPLPLPPEPDAVEQLAEQGRDIGPKQLAGCGGLVLLGVVLIAGIIAMLGGGDKLGFGGSDDDCKSAAGVSLDAKCIAPSVEATSSSDSSSESSPDASESSGDDESEDGGSDEVQTSADLPADGVGPVGGTYGPPAEEDLPQGAVLYTGSSGDQIGCITCDGASRFLSIEHPGVVVGNEGMTSQATSWPESGQILEFGANLSGPNKGRYGFNAFVGPTTYLNGCSMEIGETSCLQAREAPHVEKGMPLVIIIGEGGTMNGNKPASTGDFTVDWWFVFQPD